MRERITQCCLPTLVVLIALGGCATITTSDGEILSVGSMAFRDYVERTFREQNRWADALLYAQETAEGERYSALLDVEDALLSACAGLNELALAQRDGRSIGRLRQAKLARTAPSCETTTLRARETLSR